MMDTMDFNDIRALLSALIDGEIDDAKRHEAERLMAQCDEARTLMDEAETLDMLIARDAELLAGEPTALPRGFEAAVLAQTVEADRIVYGRRWTTWLGWVAAAACLVLAMTIWVMDRKYWLTESVGTGAVAQDTPAIGENVIGNNRRNSGGAMQANFTRRSWTLDTPLDQPNPHAPEIPVKQPVAVSGLDDLQHTSGAPVEVAASDAAESGGYAHIFRQLHALPGRVYTLAEAQDHEVPQIRALSEEDAHTLRSASALLEQLAAAETTSFRDVEAIRINAEREGVLSGLAAVRAHVDPSQRPTLLAAESILLRILRGPISQDDLRMMRDDVRQLGLPMQLDEMTGRGAKTTSF